MNNEIVVGAIFFIIGLIPAYYFYVKSIRIKEPIWSIKSNNLISGSVATLKNLSIAYKKHKVENLTVSKVLFFNRGQETITNQDINTVNHLSIASETCQILDAFVLQRNKESNNFEIAYDESLQAVSIDFDYLDKNHRSFA
jgi:hypothetical protein